jgi:osmotically inducible lipoprotein OsmB
MITIKQRTAGLAAGIMALTMLTGCDTLDTDRQTGERAATGAAVGAAAGAAVGIVTGGFLTKAIAGAAIGGAGGFIYDQVERERD